MCKGFIFMSKPKTCTALLPIFPLLVLYIWPIRLSVGNIRCLSHFYTFICFICLTLLRLLWHVLLANSCAPPKTLNAAAAVKFTARRRAAEFWLVPAKKNPARRRRALKCTRIHAAMRKSVQKRLRLRDQSGVSGLGSQLPRRCELLMPLIVVGSLLVRFNIQYKLWEETNI